MYIQIKKYMNEKIRQHFPILENGIYVDSAAMSLTPKPVLDEMIQYYKNYNVNIGRGVYRLSQIATLKYENANKKVRNFIGAKNIGEIIFTKNSTEAINMVAIGYSKWKKGDEVVTTTIEHHSNYVPWLKLKEKGVKVNIIEPNNQGIFDIDDFENAINNNTKLVAVTHISNVLGTITPIKKISNICVEKNNRNKPLLLVDGAQSVPHTKVDLNKLGCDFFAFSGHKMLGPTGTGVLWVKDLNILEPTYFGGGMVDTVSKYDYTLTDDYGRYEAGTSNIAGGIGLGKAVDYLNDIGMEKIELHENRLTTKLLNGLNKIKGVNIYGPNDPNKIIGIVSFNIDGLHPHEVALMLDESFCIMARSGYHCCMPLMNQIKANEGTIRISIYLYNTEEDIDAILNAISQIALQGV